MKKKLFTLLLCLVILLTSLPVSGNAAKAKLKITKQPEDCYVKAGDTVSITLDAQGDGLKYQWYYRNSGAAAYKVSSNRSHTYTCAMTTARDGRQVYCVITDQYGNSVTSRTATCNLPKPLKITAQPKDCYAEAGGTISATVLVQGDGLKYQWYYRNAGKTDYTVSANKTNTYTADMTTARNGRQLYCVITDRYGNSVESQVVTCHLSTVARILKQPEDAIAAFGKWAKVSMEAEGDGLTYQWYKRNVGAKTFTKSTARDATYDIKVTETCSGRQVYCVITDQYGNSVKSNTVRILAKGKFLENSYSLTVGKELALADQFDFTTDEAMVWSSSNSAIAAVSADGVVEGLKSGLVTITAVGKVTGIRSQCKVQVNPRKQIALTFDDGPSDHTARLLNYLEKKENVKVTFFMVANRIGYYKTSVKRVAQQGHELGYHSYDHQTQTNLSNSRIYSDYVKSNKIIKDLTRKSFTQWRTPGGAYSSRVLENVPLPHILWSVDTRDWATRNSNSVYNAIVNNAKDGAIILLHDLHGTTVDGAIRAIDKLLEQGYELVTVTELLSRDGTPPKNSTTYYRAN